MARNMNRRTCPEPAAMPKANTTRPTLRQNTVSSTARVQARRAWRRGTRPIPRTKQLRLTAIIKKKYGINLKTA